jgi:hypothetical protein
MTVNCLDIRREGYLTCWAAFQKDESLRSRYPSRRDFDSLVVLWRSYVHDAETCPGFEDLKGFERWVTKEWTQKVPDEVYEKEAPDQSGTPTLSAGATNNPGQGAWPDVRNHGIQDLVYLGDPALIAGSASNQDFESEAKITQIIDNGELKISSERFNIEIHDFNMHQLASNAVLHLGRPNEILRMAGVKNDEITITQKTFFTHLKMHDLTIRELRGLVEEIQRPLLIYNWGERFPSIVIVTNLSSNDGRKISIAIRIKNKGKIFSTNEVATLHGKTKDKLLDDWKKSTTAWLGQNIKWVDKEKALEWLGMAPPRGATLTDPALISIAKIVQAAADSKFFAIKMRGIVENKDIKPAAEMTAGAADRADNAAISQKNIKNKQD